MKFVSPIVKGSSETIVIYNTLDLRRRVQENFVNLYYDCVDDKIISCPDYSPNYILQWWKKSFIVDLQMSTSTLFLLMEDT